MSFSDAHAPDRPMHSSPRIAVIGAGIAGLSCAAALAQAGAAVTLYEKSRGPGGRMSTRRGEGWQCDHGAQYVTARDPAFRAEVSRWVHAGAAALWTPRLQVLGGAVARHPDPSVQRFVGTPSMAAPARLLANGLHVVAQTTIAGLGATGGRAGDRQRPSGAEASPARKRCHK
jgi:predicted NAD/FAD-dependent oxidoreductase